MVIDKIDFFYNKIIKFKNYYKFNFDNLKQKFSSY